MADSAVITYTPETLLSTIINNPGISYEDITADYKDADLWHAFYESLQELRFQKKIHVVRYTCWKVDARSNIRYYAAEWGDIVVLDVMKDLGRVLEYDPYETRKKATEEAQ